MRIAHFAIALSSGISLQALALTVKIQRGIESDGTTSAVAGKSHLDLVAASSLTTARLNHTDPGVSAWNSDFYPSEQYLKTRSSDWLFHVQTTSCLGTAFDADTHSRQSRILLPTLFILALVAITFTSFGYSAPQAAGSLLASHDSTDFPDGGDTSPDAMLARKLSLSTLKVPETSRQRLWHLDFARICAVFCVVGEHSGGEDYTHRNFVFGLWWVLPYLYMTSGMGCMMSKKSMPAYVARLAIIFFVGVGANWVADLVNRRDWQHDFGNTIFQMFFVIMLIVMAIISEPLRAALQRRRDHGFANSTKTTMAALVIFGTITLLALWHFMCAMPVLPDGPKNSWFQYYQEIFDNIPIFVSQVGGMMFLSLYSTCICPPEKTGEIGWILLAYTYVPMVMIPWDESNFSHCMALYIFATVVTVWPLRGSQAIADWVRSYWALLIMILLIFSMPDMWGRCDEHPPYATWERLRFNLGELTLVVCFVSGSFAMADPYNVTAWLGYWALYAYCFHMMWFRLLGCPYGAVVTFSFIGVFYILHRMGILGTLRTDQSKNQDAYSGSSADATAKA